MASSTTGRSTNTLLTVPADASEKPTTWPQYVMGSKALPEANREESCYPLSAEDKGVKILSKGWQKDSRRRRLPQDLLWDQNVSVTMRDGINLQLDVFRSTATEHDGKRVPTILMYGPYGKSGAGPQQVSGSKVVYCSIS
jgi:predicted acyl esterase